MHIYTRTHTHTHSPSYSQNKNKKNLFQLSSYNDAKHAHLTNTFQKNPNKLPSQKLQGNTTLNTH